ncbi:MULTISPECIES: hypothetical protein [unclassified Arthrobacter]|uniref:hypothetical protein n=1 Tax=unclassified Arthrobacter TaxID=235627 RepID=UPI001CFF69F6|nr:MULTISPECIES: hypothetical protein [unclassified Arthrobacter]MCB5282729.1 hypothetical protein [Arthrobacter sp. ES1]WGZ79084.1 hypothetical protein QI450_14670 [Arthrobacter sp. EM1]
MLLASNPGAPALYRLRAGIRLDSDGDPVESWATPERVLLRGAKVQPVSSTEDDGARRLIEGEGLLIVPGSPNLKATDRVEIDAEVWLVNGTPVVRCGLASGVYTSATLTRIASAA